MGCLLHAPRPGDLQPSTSTGPGPCSARDRWGSYCAPTDATT
ncbi:hypothetical protein D623_10004785 [Myotis brandtii]|uniref:Uncharacterized protein n=1 Tax=Myotis brandtii TaxID=109478 RepID=S7MH64_MYOBR|nr:hypothetical protein D623_10004785 [Myotis brandtii]